MLAVEAPVSRMLAVGGLVLAVATGMALRPHHAHAHGHHRHHLTLHAPSEPNAVYYTVFAHGPWSGDETATLDAWVSGEGIAAMRHADPYVVRSHVETPDACYWDVSETFTMIDEQHFAYAYDEMPAGCEPDALPSYIATPRVGEVVVDE